MPTGGYMTAEEWIAFVARQVEHILYHHLDVKEGKFRFRRASTQPGRWLGVRISADRTVLEGARWSETWQRAGETVTSRPTLFERTFGVPSGSLRVSPTGWAVYVSTDKPAGVLQIAARTDSSGPRAETA